MIDADNLSNEADEADTTEDVQLAKDMGWVEPKDWKGSEPKNGFLSAKEFIRRGEKIMPIVRAEARKWQDEATKLRSELETTRQEHRKTIDRIERMSAVTLEAQRDQIEAKYADRIERAAEVGDKDAVRVARKEEKEALTAIDEKLKEPEEKPNGKDNKPELPKVWAEAIEQFESDNRWFTQQPGDEMSAYAMAVHMRLLREKKGLTPKQNLEEVVAATKKRFPEHFSADDEPDDDEPRRGSRVEGGSRMNGGGPKTGWSKVPSDARKVAEDAGHLAYFLKDGETMEKNKAQAQERWATKYFEGESK